MQKKSIKIINADYHFRNNHTQYVQKLGMKLNAIFFFFTMFKIENRHIAYTIPFIPFNTISFILHTRRGAGGKSSFDRNFWAVSRRSRVTA